MESPKTQSIAAVKTLIEFMTGEPCVELPAIFNLAGGARLIKSSKGDCFYTVTAKTCSCPASAYNPGQVCKHRKALMDGASLSPSRTQAMDYQQRQREARQKAKAGRSEPVDSIRPTGKWPGGHNGPVLEIAGVA
jgi:hypothetical protein